MIACAGFCTRLSSMQRQMNETETETDDTLRNTEIETDDKPRNTETATQISHQMDAFSAATVERKSRAVADD